MFGQLQDLGSESLGLAEACWMSHHPLQGPWHGATIEPDCTR